MVIQLNTSRNVTNNVLNNGHNNDSVPLWNVALFWNFQMPCKMVLIRKTMIARFLEAQGGNETKAQTKHLGQKNRGPRSTESKGTKKGPNRLNTNTIEKTVICHLPTWA